MRPFGDDIPAEVEAMRVERYRQMSPAAKAAEMSALNAAARAAALAELRLAHPTETERELRLRLALQSIDRDLLERAFGRLPG